MINRRIFATLGVAATIAATGTLLPSATPDAKAYEYNWGAISWGWQGNTGYAVDYPNAGAAIRARLTHARAAARFVQCAERFDAEITVTKDQTTVGGTSIMGLMMLGAAMGDYITISAAGDGAEAADQHRGNKQRVFALHDAERDMNHDESVGRIERHVEHEADVLTFRCVDRAHASVVR
mgnify:CR=1 FL=1